MSDPQETLFRIKRSKSGMRCLGGWLSLGCNHFGYIAGILSWKQGGFVPNAVFPQIVNSGKHVYSPWGTLLSEYTRKNLWNIESWPTNVNT